MSKGSIENRLNEIAMQGGCFTLPRLKRYGKCVYSLSSSFCDGSNMQKGFVETEDDEYGVG